LGISSIFLYTWVLSIVAGALIFFGIIALLKLRNRARFKKGDVLILKGVEAWSDKSLKIIEILEVGKNSYLYRFMDIETSLDKNNIIVFKREQKSIAKEAEFEYINKNYERFKNKTSKLADAIYS
jgi:hypothetical protein